MTRWKPLPDGVAPQVRDLVDRLRELMDQRIDGLFGEHTERAVKQLQSAAGAVADGKVGPQTWALLRG